MTNLDLFAVTGRPVLHSASPGLFKPCFPKVGLAAAYTRLAADSAREAMDLFESLGLRGMNVTSPFKEDIVPLLARLDPVAEKIGAVNVVARTPEGTVGRNTDHLGVIGALNKGGMRPMGERALVVGAGGAGRAAAYGLKKAGAHVTIISRDPERARAAAERLGCNAGTWDTWRERAPLSRIVVLALPPAVPRAGLPLLNGQIVVDPVYGGEPRTGDGLPKNVRAVPGTEWLRFQAAPSFEAMTGRSVAVEDMAKANAPALRPSPLRDNIALIGFSGAGKTAVGRRLAALLGYDFVDTDEWIEAADGATIPEIFERRGEAWFRDREMDAVESVAGLRRTVVAHGGGVIDDRQNAFVLAEQSLVIWLDAPLEVALARIDPSTRPLLAPDGSADRAREIYERRRPGYFAAADLVVRNAGTDPQAAAERIHEEIRSVGG